MFASENPVNPEDLRIICMTAELGIREYKLPRYSPQVGPSITFQCKLYEDKLSVCFFVTKVEQVPETGR